MRNNPAPRLMSLKAGVCISDRNSHTVTVTRSAHRPLSCGLAAAHGPASRKRHPCAHPRPPAVPSGPWPPRSAHEHTALAHPVTVCPQRPARCLAHSQRSGKTEGR